MADCHTDVKGHRGRNRFCQQSRNDSGLHNCSGSARTNLQSNWWWRLLGSLYNSPIGDHQRYASRHHLLLHNQWHHTYDLFDLVYGTYYCQCDGDPAGYRGRDRLYQQPREFDAVYHCSNTFDASFLACGRYLHHVADCNYQRSNGRRNHLLHNQRDYAHHFVQRIQRCDHSQRDRDTGSHRSGDRLHQQSGSHGGLHNQPSAACADVLSGGRNLHGIANSDHQRC